MKRILFVDDEPSVLQALQRMLRPMRNEWEMTFVQTGADALTALAHAPFDVILTDMRMPGMDGAALLNTVRQRYPNMVRLALSGQSQQEVVLRSVASTHQFLAKPCDADVLKDTVTRACALRELLADERLKELVSQLSSLPSLPALYTAIIKELRSASASIQRVGEIISKDVGMSAKILHLVNSAFFGLRRHVANPNEAVRLLGLEAIKALVLSAHVFSQFSQPADGALSLEALWQHSLSAGTGARRIAAAESAPSQTVDHALMAGLLHDVGRLILASHCADSYLRVIELARGEHLELWCAEQRVLNTTHAAVGAYLLALWGLPDPIVEAVAYHHGPRRCPHSQFGPLTAVHAADALSGSNHGVEGIKAPELDGEYLRGLGLEARPSAWRQLSQEGLESQMPVATQS